ncbi:MAG: alpha-2-macroglobulin family protein, partial [Alphaproteobacteria bacterium]|nr:alpha-2-macroglobulin family protein [Alphaproteobacteria bacterium]
PAEALLKAADTLSARFAQARYTSTQEQTWLLLAARALFDRREPLQLSIDGTPVSDPGKSFGLSLDAQRLGRGLALANRGTAPARYVVTTEGYPRGDLPPEGNGFAIERQWLATTGEPIDLSKVEQGTLVVGLIGGKAELKQGSKIRALVVDLLPAGFELENAAIGAGRSAEQFSWLPERTAATWRSMRDDRFVAAIEIKDGEEFALAYLMRAVTPGEYRAPAVFVEDMYRPAFQARGAVGRAAVVAK